jgi:cellobiose phosphorylase
MTRYFRNSKYEIEVSNPHNICRGVKAVLVDGVSADSNKIPAFNDGNTHSIEIIMG